MVGESATGRIGGITDHARRTASRRLVDVW
jgi:hypothetical protein